MKSNEYTPTTEEVRQAYIAGRTSLSVRAAQEEFDRWLMGVEQDVWNDGHSAGWYDAIENEHW